MLADSSKMDALLGYLQMVNEMSYDELEPIRIHFNLAQEVQSAEEQKKKAAIEEDYELAAQMKKQITKLKEQALTADKLRTEFLSKEPVFRTYKMVHQMNDIDSCFTKEFIEKKIRQANGGQIVPGDKRLKATVVNQLLVL